MRPIAVIYENEAWMAPLFAALEDAGAPVARVFANTATFDPRGPAPEWSLAVNKVSPSSYLRSHGPSISFARAYLPFLEASGVPVVNGSEAFRLETSKALQLQLLDRLAIRAPRAHVANETERILAAAAGLRFPVIVKPNVGGSGALMRRFDSLEELRDGAAPSGPPGGTPIDRGPDGTVLVQEYLEPEDGSIVRVEFLDGQFLYAIRITNDSEADFNLCPADICQIPESTDQYGNAVVGATAKKPLRIEAFDAPGEMIDAVLRIAREGKLDVGGVEYLVARRDGLPYVYDINALSNFVTDAPSLVGFDPHARFAEYLLDRAKVAA
jgi:glutathione synthase/RimK-type ligase-like ATP-grasp enzyme